MITKSNYQSTPCDNTVNTVQYWLSNWALQLTRFFVLYNWSTKKTKPTDSFSKPNWNRTEAAVFLKTEPNLKNQFRTSLGSAEMCITISINYYHECKVRRNARTTLKELQEAAVLHQFSDNVDWFILGAHSVQLDQLAVPQFLHYRRLRQEVFRVHRTWHIHNSAMLVPRFFFTNRSIWI